jgi:hypothetical protein
VSLGGIRRLDRHARVAGLLIVAWSSSAGSGLAQKVSAEHVVASLDRYFDTYRLALGEVVAEERMVQHTGGRTLDDPNAIRTIEVTREIVSDVAFAELPGDVGWMGFRETKKVNGRAVARTGPSLIEALTSGGATAREQARALLQASATHNLGEPRTINLPNLPLELLQPRHRHRFRIVSQGADRVGGVQTVVILFEETHTPTVIQRPRGGDIFTVVRAWVEPTAGRLWRAHVRLVDARAKAGGIRAAPATIEVRFAQQATLGLLVPDLMVEAFYAQGSGPGRGEAHYTNYRRFTTAARIVPP